MTVATLEAMEDEQPDVEVRSPLSAPHETVIRRPSMKRLLIKRSCLRRFWYLPDASTTYRKDSYDIAYLPCATLGVLDWLLLWGRCLACKD